MKNNWHAIVSVSSSKLIDVLCVVRAPYYDGWDLGTLNSSVFTTTGVILTTNITNIG